MLSAAARMMQAFPRAVERGSSPPGKGAATPRSISTAHTGL